MKLFKLIVIRIIAYIMFIVIILVAFVLSLMSPVIVLYGGIKLLITGEFKDTTEFVWIPTIKGWDICIFSMRVPIIPFLYTV